MSHSMEPGKKGGGAYFWVCSESILRTFSVLIFVCEHKCSWKEGHAITVEIGRTFNGLWACTVVKVLAQTERDAQKDQPKKGGWWNK